MASRQSPIGPALREQSASPVRERNIRLVVSYDGTDFHGWQRQPSQPTVQGCLEESLARIVGQSVKLYGSGRTDAGVHALGQVANFMTSCRIPCGNLVEALNHLLPPTIRVGRADEVPLSFHARYDVRSKTYRYRILQANVCAPFLRRFVWHYPYPLDRESMAEGARVFLGEHDFTAFAASERPEEDAPDHGNSSRRLHQGGNPPHGPLALAGEIQNKAHAPRSRHPEPSVVLPQGGTGPDEGVALDASEPRSTVRTVYSWRLLWRPRTKILTYEVRGSGFLHHMIRNMVGTLVEVGRGKLAAEDLVRILAARDRTLAGPTAPAQGLCLVRVEY